MRAALQTQAKASPLAPVRSGLLQRKCACGGTTGPTGECEACSKKREPGTLQRAADRSSTLSPRPFEIPPIVHEVLRSPGQPLDADTRASMEPSFGHDFGRVRVHTDAAAAKSAEAVSAYAYTMNNDIVFGGGKYEPNSDSGRRLISHELTHVVQQRRGIDLRGVSEADNAYERHANEVAEALANGGTASRLLGHSPVSTGGGAGGVLQRQSDINDPGQRTVVEDKLPDKTLSSDPWVLVAAVGREGVNRADDVAKVQLRLLALGLLSEGDFVTESPSVVTITPVEALDLGGVIDSTALAAGKITLPADSLGSGMPVDSLGVNVSTPKASVAASTSSDAKEAGSEITPTVLSESSLTATIAAIRKFQRALFREEAVDGNIGPSGPTWRALSKADVASFTTMSESWEAKKEQIEAEKARKRQESARTKDENARKLKEEAGRKGIESQRKSQEADKQSTATANKLLAAYATYLPLMSNYISLDKSGLARVLSIYARFDYRLVIKVLDALKKEDAEEVATEMVEKATVFELSTFVMGVLLHLLFTMWEKQQSAKTRELSDRVLLALAFVAVMALKRQVKSAGGLVWPVETSGSALISCFGPRHYFSKDRGWVDDVHPGIDISQRIDTPVYAAAPGKVVLAGPIGGYGNNVIAIRHSTTLLTSYGHMNSKVVKLNDEVTGGQTIGTVGTQGISEGPHLHFNVTTGENPPPKKIYNGNVNPLQSGLSIPAGVPNPKKCK